MAAIKGVSELPQEVVNPYASGSMVGTAWEQQEGDRLSTMDQYLGMVTRADLLPVFDRLAADYPDEEVTLLDVGAATGTTTEELSNEAGVTYNAFDVKEEYLAARATPEDHKFLGRSEDMSQFSDGAFNVTYSRAATAWSSNQEASIAEQLRITGDVAVFTEYDWTQATVESHDHNIVAAGFAAKMAMMGVLVGAGFDPDLGASLQEKVAAVATGQGYTVEQQHERHELPIADHRALFMDAANTIRAQLEGAAGNPNANAATRASAHTAAAMLGKYLKIIDSAPASSVYFRLPALSTEIVRIVERPEAN